MDDLIVYDGLRLYRGSGRVTEVTFQLTFLEKGVEIIWSDGLRNYESYDSFMGISLQTIALNALDPDEKSPMVASGSLFIVGFDSFDHAKELYLTFIQRMEQR